MNKHLKGLFFFEFLVSIFCITCNNSAVRVIKTYPDGKTMTEIEYENKDDVSNYSVKVFYPDGKIKKEARVAANQYVGKKITFYQNGKILQVDSLSEPCDTGVATCSGTIIRYNENGTISLRFSFKAGFRDGLAEHYD